MIVFPIAIPSLPRHLEASLLPTNAMLAKVFYPVRTELRTLSFVSAKVHHVEAEERFYIAIE